MEGVIFGFFCIACFFGIILFFNKQQDKKDAISLIEMVKRQEMFSGGDIHKNIFEYRAISTFKALLPYLRVNRKGRINILKSELDKLSIESKEIKDLINRSLSIFFHLHGKLGSPLDNFCDKDFYLEKVKAYESFNDADFWKSNKEKTEYIKIWNNLCEKGVHFYTD